MTVTPTSFLTWRLVLVAAVVPLSFALAASDPDDKPGSHDPAPFSRMPGFSIARYDELQFDHFAFKSGADKTEDVEGHRQSVYYSINNGVTVPSGLQVMRNYETAAKKLGGKVLSQWEDGGTQYLVLKVVTATAELWVQVSGASNGMYTVELVEKQLMQQDVVADASALSASLTATGKAAVYGIYFDTDKAEVKPESKPSLVEIAKLLKASPQLKLYVVGHTDNVGGFDHNVKLSNARAAAVVSALTSQHGVAAARLTPFGAGPTSPAASNASEAGRAKNRRVELVAQ
jgi:outer membrane protein OmpA-like peptidoglycan-associated protein